jgi:hypothetical protein
MNNDLIFAKTFMVTFIVAIIFWVSLYFVIQCTDEIMIKFNQQLYTK